MKVLDTQALHLPVYSKGLKILWFLYFSLVLISEQTKRFGGLRDLFCHQHFELLRRQALPLPVDICHFRKPARRPRLASITSTPPPPPPPASSLLQPGTSWPSGSEGSGNMKAPGLEGARNSSRCISLASDKPRRRAGRAGDQGLRCPLPSIHLLVPPG